MSHPGRGRDIQYFVQCRSKEIDISQDDPGAGLCERPAEIDDDGGLSFTGPGAGDEQASESLVMHPELHGHAEVAERFGEDAIVVESLHPALVDQREELWTTGA